MKKILVIGGAGFIGSHTVLALIEAGYEPVILDNFSNSEKFIIKRLSEFTSSKLTYYDSDYRDVNLLEKVIKKEQIAGIIHFAAFKAVGESVEKPLKYYSNNVSGFVDLLKVSLKCHITNFVFSSSAAVYGTPSTIKVSEESDCQPTSPYGWSKRFDEIILEDTCRAYPRLNGIALRYFNVVGAHPSAKIGELPKGKPQNLLPIIVRAVSGKIPPFTVFGDDYPTPDGTCLRDYIHVVDLATAHVQALKLAFKTSGGYQVFNIGTGKATSVMELIKTFEKINNVKVPHKIGERRPGDPAAYYALKIKAKKQLGWQSELSIEDAVKSAWQWEQSLNS